MCYVDCTILPSFRLDIPKIRFRLQFIAQSNNKLIFFSLSFFSFFFFPMKKKNITFLGDDLLEFHQAVVSTLRDADDIPIPLDPAPMMPHIPNTHSMMMPPIMNDELGRISDVVNTDQPLDPEDEMDPGMDD